MHLQKRDISSLFMFPCYRFGDEYDRKQSKVKMNNPIQTFIYISINLDKLPLSLTCE